MSLIPGYLLSFADGTTFTLRASPAARVWLENFARICSLPRTIDSTANIIWFSESGELLPKACRSGSSVLPLYFYDLHEKGATTACVLHERWIGRGAYPFRMAEAVTVLCRMMLGRAAFPLHAALFESRGNSILIAAPGGTGKFTCAANAPPAVRVLADDMALAVPTAEGWYTHPLPTWSDYYLGRTGDAVWETPSAVPLAAVFLLRRGDADTAAPLTAEHAAEAVFQAAADKFRVFWHFAGKDEAERMRMQLFDTACRFAADVPVYALTAQEGPEYWDAVAGVLEGRA